MNLEDIRRLVLQREVRTPEHDQDKISNSDRYATEVNLAKNEATMNAAYIIANELVSEQ